MGWWCEVRWTYIPDCSASLAASLDIPASRVVLPSWIILIVLAALVAANSKVPHAACSPTRMPVLGQQEGEPVQ